MWVKPEMIAQMDTSAPLVNLEPEILQTTIFVELSGSVMTELKEAETVFVPVLI